MKRKVPLAIHWPKFRIPGIDYDKRLTKNVRENLRRNWVHPFIRARRFVLDYSVPVTVTVVFLLIVAVALVLRTSQRSSLAHLLASVTSAGKEYGTLLSKDKTDELKRNDDVNQPGDSAPAGSATSFTLNAGNPSSTTNTTASGGSGTGSVSPSPSPTPPPVFSAAIAFFRQDSSELVCTSQNQKLQTCSKRYTYSGGIRTQNGPGTVNYGWRSNLSSATEDASISAGAGEVVTTVQKVITLACTAPSSFSLQLVILSPGFTQSPSLQVNHNCLGL